MGREERSFDQAYREFLPEEQRREVLKALREKLDPETTFGEIVDAARSLGWEDALGQVLLSELASTLLGETSSENNAQGAAELDPALSGRARELEAAIVDGLTNWSEEDEAPTSTWQADDEQDEVEATAAPAKKRGRPAKKKSSKKKTSKKKSSKKKASKKKSSKKKNPKKKASKKKSSKKRSSKKKASKKKSSKKRGSKKKASKKKSVKKRSSKKKAAKKKAAKKRGKKSGRRR